jgi:hypothetical protein
VSTSRRSREDDAQQRVWLPAAVEVLDVTAAPRPSAAEDTLVPGARRACRASDLRVKRYFDPTFLGIVLSDVLGKAADVKRLSLAKAVDITDKAMAGLGLLALGDFSYEERRGYGEVEYTCRIYAGRETTMAAICATEGTFDLVLLTELAGGEWVVTGLADGIQTRMVRTGGRPAIILNAMDEPLRDILAKHDETVRSQRSAPRPAPLEPFAEAVAACNRFLETLD